MTTAAEIITSARYDVRDEDITQYSNALMLDYLNRGLRPLCVVLSMLKSDWVNTETNLTLTSGESSVALPDQFVTPINAKIGTEDLTKKSVSWIRNSLIENSTTTGLPTCFAIQGLLLLVDIIASEDYTIIFEYNTKVEDLSSSSDMPFNDEFNDIMRQFLVLMCKSRNEYTLLSDAYMQEFFYQAAFSKLVSRNHINNINKTDF